MSQESDLARSEQKQEQEKDLRFRVTVDPDCKPKLPTPEEKGWHDDKFGGDPNKE